MGPPVGTMAPAFYGFHDGAYVLDLIEGITGGISTPTNRVGSVPWGFIAECPPTVMQKVFGQLERVPRYAVRIGIIPPTGRGVRRLQLQPPHRRASTGTSAARRQALPRVQRSRLEGLDASRRRLVRARYWVRLQEHARVGTHGAATARRVAERPDHGEGPAPFKVPAGEVRVNTENPLGEMGYRRSKGATGRSG